MINPEENLKETANILAEHLYSEHGAKTLALLRRLSTGSKQLKPDKTVPSGNSGASGHRRIGIWEAQEKNGEVSFVRSQTGESWIFWANEARIQPKTDKKRVVLLGESVARGFFYDPLFNPAMALRSMLQGSPRKEVEVVDLARIDLQIRQLQQMLWDALILQPDVMVVLAGNNWHPSLCFDLTHMEQIARLVRAGQPWSRVKKYLETCLSGQVNAFLKDMARLSKEHNVPIVFVLPEGNLVDWQDECSAPLFMGASQTESWFEIRENAEAAFNLGDYQAAAAATGKLIEMDGGTTWAGLSIRASLETRAGRFAEARTLLEQARDSGICLARPESPRCYSTIQTALRQQSAALGIHLVDLPAHFADYLGQDLPGRNLFHDYCHLTVEGVRVAMAAVAAELRPIVGLPARDWRELIRVKMEVNPDAVAYAHFLSAIHNANWGQDPEVIHYHCEQAIRQSPRTAAIVKLFLDFYVRRQPSCLCRSFESIGQIQNVAIFNHLFDPATIMYEKPLNLDLVRGMIDAVKRANPEDDFEIDGLLHKERGLRETKTDLLQKAYCFEAIRAPEERQHHAFFQSHMRTSQFQIIADAWRAVRMEMVHREPGPEGALTIGLNGTRVFEVSTSREWNREIFDVAPERLRHGLNLLTIHWPPASWVEDIQREQVASRFESGEISDIRGVYGEIFELTARLI